MARGARVLVLGAGLLAAAAPARAQSSFADATSMTWDGVLTGIFLGLLLFSLAYNAVFYRLLRERFLIWQSVRALSYFALAVALSPLAMGAWLAPDSFARQVWITIFFDLSLVVSGVFLRSYLEPEMVGPRLYRWLGWPPVLILLTTPATVMPDAGTYMMLRSVVMVAMLALCAATVAMALKRGSRTARYQAAAWSGIGGVYGVSLFHDIVLGQPFDSFLFLLFPALGLEVMLTAFGILDRLMRLRRERQEARAQAEAMRIIAHTDPLTGLPNRRAIEESFNDEPPVAIALVDLDHFKAINDRYGHARGDEVLRHFAAAGRQQSRAGDLFARIGGEEFLMLMPGAGLGEAMHAMERLRCHVARAEDRAGPGCAYTMSAGVAEFCGNAVEDLFERADRALYSAKRLGRDRIEQAP